MDERLGVVRGCSQSGPAILFESLDIYTIWTSDCDKGTQLQDQHVRQKEIVIMTLRPLNVYGVFVMSIAVVASGALRTRAESVTPWPTFQSALAPATSSSPNVAQLPADVKISTPIGDVPPQFAAFSGLWSGWMCQDHACSTKLAVESLNKMGATIVYAFANAQNPGYWERVSATFEQGELRARLAGGVQLAYRLRGDGNMDVLWRKGSSWASGLLTRIE